MTTPTNVFVTQKLYEAADLLEAQKANPLRVQAYRRAGDTVSDVPEDLGYIVEHQGMEGLDALPGIGRGFAGAILELLRSGRWSPLERLRGEVDPEALFQTIPGVGARLTHRIHDALQLEMLEGLEAAAHDGRLAALPGVGRRRAAMIRAALAERLGRRPLQHLDAATAVRPSPATEPTVAVFLDVDPKYRRRESTDDLPKVAPRRFNPSGKPWLPVLHTERGPWRFTALHSNTARAHDLGRVQDWG